MIGRLQALDRNLFGGLTSVCGKLVDLHSANHPEVKMDQSLKVQVSIDAWERIGFAVLRREWTIYREDPKRGDEEGEVGE
jgi:hypothetical protein